MASEASPRRSAILVGLFLIAFGAWFLLDNLGFDLPGLDRLWPVFPTAGGLVLIGAALADRPRAAGLLIPGVGGLLVGLFFFTFTLELLAWDAMGELWPVFPLIGGIAFLAVWLASEPRDPALLVPAGLGVGVGVIGLLLTLGGFRMRTVVNLWPLVLILIGAWILLQELGRPTRPPTPPDTPAADPPA